MAMSELHSVCTHIHDTIQRSGLHFFINQTPWSSYITIRKKFVDKKDAVDVNVKSRGEMVTEVEELVDLREKKKNLEDKLSNIEVGKVHLEEELKLSVEKSKNTIAHLHVQMSSLKSALEETNVDLEDRKDKIIFLEKETKRKDEIIQHMNARFNKKSV